MKKVTICLFIASLIIGCEKQPQIELNDPKPVNKILESLEAAYEDSSLVEYEAILSYWELENAPKSKDDLYTEAEEDIYEIFQAFYTPFDISRLGDHEWTEPYEGYKYAVVQNHVYYDYLLDSEGDVDYEDMDTIKDFRPEIKLEGKTILYLSDNYHEALYEFLGTDFEAFGSGGIMNPAYPTDESWNRLQFLKNHLAIIPGHWGGYYHIATHPEASRISFNSKANEAEVHFRVGYMFGSAQFRKRLGSWKMISSAITSIEK